MKVTAFTKEALYWRRFNKKSLRDGYIRLQYPYLPIVNGGDYRKVITDVKISPCGKDLYIKIEEK